MTEEIDVYEVQLLDRSTKEVLKSFDAGQDYDLAQQKMDEWNLEYCDGTMFTKIEIFSEEVED